MKKKLQPAITLLQQYMAQDMTVYAGHATLFLLTAFFPLLMWLYGGQRSRAVFPFSAGSSGHS